MAGIDIYSLNYPKALTNADWQKAKGKIGKLTKTGLGDALTKAEAAFKKIDKSVLDPSSNPLKTMDELQDAVDRAKKHYAATVVPFAKELDNVIKAAKDAESKLGKAIGGKDAAKAAAAVQKEAEWLRVGCKSLDLEKPVEKVKADIQKKNDLAAKFLNDSLKKFATGAATFLRSPSKESWESNIKQQGRSVSNSVAQLQNYRAKFWKDFEKFKGFDQGTLGLEGDDDAVNEKRSKIVKLAVMQVKSIAAFKG
ncbi:hypothetical protein OEW28_02610 [Defluviimonas sp. WL0002]|uniref:Uncharacterized protein n=1 Tax=Albidovulum marisflavi TaxID=2984159 RepID=A0ABT2Z8P2_9RHOB|nr:hypothetical protein [Defluviimonas sp. WL0002]MCV2867515.1 hypothetical protein [Defluviimonas sp. WL0002]